MAIISVTASTEATLSVVPSEMLINTSDTLAQVMATGYLNGQTIIPCGFFGWPQAFVTDQLARVVTTDYGIVQMIITIDGSSNVNLSLANVVAKKIITSPEDSASSSLAIGTAYQNNFGYDVMLSVYLNVTSATSASVLLGVGATTNPAQQTIISGLTLSVLGVIPVNIYLPNGYYAHLSTSGTITLGIAGQIAMPI